MAASVAEQILARIQTLLTSATSASTRVYRDHVDPIAEAQTPAIDIRRTDSSTDPIGNSGDRVYVEWDIDFYVAAAAIATAADALHMAAHTLLAADTTLAQKGRGLRCMGTSFQGASADRRIGVLTARYRMQVFVRPGDLTTAIN